MSRTNRGRQWRRYAICAALIGVLTAAAFGRILGHPFVSLDDKEYVTENPVVLRGLTFDGLRWALTTFTASNWHPATWLSHMADVQFFGISPALHHATSLLLHLVAAVTLFVVLAEMTGATGRSLFVAALFAVHPLHVESVAWVAERKDVLSGLFFTLALAAWLRYVRRPSRGRFLAAGAIFATGLAAKAMLVTLPFLMGLLDLWPFSRLGLDAASGTTRRPGRSSAGWLVLEKVPFLVLSAAASALTYTAQLRGGSLLSSDALPLPWRLGNAAVSAIRYLSQAVWPADLAVLYAHQGVRLPIVWGAAAGLIVVGVTIFALQVMRRLPWLSVGWLWYLGMLVPVMGIVQAGSQGMADRYTYLPLIGFFLIVVWGAESVARHHSWRRHVPWLAAGPILAALTATAFLQAGYWQDSRSLLSRAVLVSPDSWMALVNLALVADAEGKPTEALDLYRRAAKAAPSSPIVRFNLGTVLSRAGRSAEAEAAYRAAIALDPGLAAAHNNLANILFRQGRHAEALASIRAAAAAAPYDLPIRANLERMVSAGGRR